MTEIGGYFELELPKSGSFPHSLGLLYNTGRNALQALLDEYPRDAHFYVPEYTCHVVFQAFTNSGRHFSTYRINGNLEIQDLPPLKSNDYLLYTNYYGIKDNYITGLAEQYKDHLIIDNSQSLFSKCPEYSSAFYSYRKFVGVPDGASLITNSVIEKERERDCSFQRCSHLLKRIDLDASSGYNDFVSNDNSFDNLPVRSMSTLTKRLLSSIDWERIKDTRLRNFNHLHKALKSSNRLNIPTDSDYNCPMVYPYWTEDSNLRQRLIQNKIFVATYWPNVLQSCQPESLEYQLAENLIPLPIDQRYGKEEMNRILELI